MKWGLVSLKPLDPNYEKMEWLYKGDDFINDIAYGSPKLPNLFSVI